MRSLGWLMLGLALEAGELSAQSLTGQVTMLEAAPGSRPSLFVPASVRPGAVLETIADNRAAVYLRVEGEPAADVSLYLEAESRVRVVEPTDAVPLHVVVEKGSVLVQLAGGVAKAPLVVSTPDPAAWVRVQPGSLIWIDAAADQGFGLIEGAATRFAGAAPTADPAGVQGGDALAPRPELHERAAELTGRLARSRTTTAGWGWIERASQGELVPAPRGAQTRLASRETVRVAPVNPQAVAIAAPATVSTAVSVTPAVSQARALLASQNPASVLVGARLERTRIVGNPGAAGGGTGLQFNRQVRGPLNLSPGP